MVGVRVAADSFQLQLGAGEQLERIVVKRAREAPPRLVATSRDVVEQMTARGHRLLEADRGTPELVFGFLVLPDQARGHSNEPEGPQGVGGVAVGGVVDGDGAYA